MFNKLVFILIEKGVYMSEECLELIQLHQSQADLSVVFATRAALKYESRPPILNLIELDQDVPPLGAAADFMTQPDTAIVFDFNKLVFFEPE